METQRPYTAGNSDVKREQPPQQPAMDEIMGRLQSTRGQLNFVHEHLSGVLGRAYGAEPQDDPKANGLRPVRCGAVGAIEEIQEEIAHRLTQICNQLSRLETIV